MKLDTKTYEFLLAFLSSDDHAYEQSSLFDVPSSPHRTPPHVQSMLAVAVLCLIYLQESLSQANF